LFFDPNCRTLEHHAEVPDLEKWFPAYASNNIPYISLSFIWALIRFGQLTKVVFFGKTPYIYIDYEDWQQYIPKKL
jgi:hypothetical protein